MSHEVMCTKVAFQDAFRPRRQDHATKTDQDQVQVQRKIEDTVQMKMQIKMTSFEPADVQYCTR